MSSPSTPPRTRRPRVFYGWYVIGMSSVAGLFAGGTSQAFFGVFVKSIEAETGWSRTTIAGVITVATFGGGAMTVLVGRLADKSGPRVLMAAGALLYAAGYAGMSFVTQAWHLYVAYFIARVAALHLLSGVVPRTAAINWFRRMRGRAVGIQTTAMPLGGALLAALAGALLANGMDWRTVFLLFSVAATVFLVVPLPLVMRRQPEDMGLLPDGAPAPPTTPAAGEGRDQTPRASGEEMSWTFKQALRTRALWLITLGMLVSSWASGGVSFHLPAYYADIGLGTGVAAAAASVFLLSGALSSGIWGFLTERFSERHLVVFATAVAAGLTFYARFVSEPAGGLLFAALFGATTRGESALLMMLLAGYFGRRHFGTISGFAAQFTFFGLGAGPFVFSLMFGVTGNYDGVFWAATAMLCVALAALWLARKPVLRSETVH